MQLGIMENKTTNMENKTRKPLLLSDACRNYIQLHPQVRLPCGVRTKRNKVLLSYFVRKFLLRSVKLLHKVALTEGAAILNYKTHSY